MDNLSESSIAQSLVHRVIAGDASAETDIVQKYQRGLKFVILRKCQDPYLTDDICQETWGIVIEKLRNQELRDATKLAAFIIQIAKNRLTMHFRRSDVSKTEPLQEQLDSVAADNVNPVKEIVRADLRKIIEQVMAELSTDRDRDMLMRFFIHEQEKCQICMELKLQPQQFDRVFSRARQRFRMLCEKHDAN